MRAVLQDRNLCVDVIGTYLTTKELARLLLTCKRLHSFRPAFFETICECWQEFGRPKLSNFKKWIEKCIVLDDVVALRYFVVEECVDANFKLFNQVYSNLLPIVSTKASLSMLCSVCDLYDNVLHFSARILAVSLRSILKWGLFQACDDSMQYLLTRYEKFLFEERDVEFERTLLWDIIIFGRRQELFDFMSKRFQPRPLFYADNIPRFAQSFSSTRYVDFFLAQPGVREHRDKFMRWLVFNPNPAIRDYLRLKFQSE